MELFLSLGIRLLVGIPLSIVGAFVGMIINSITIPSPVEGSIAPFLVRLLIVGFGAALGSLLAWFNLLDSRRGQVYLFLIAALGGTGGAWLGFLIGGATIFHPDSFELNQQVSQAVLFGAGLGANAIVVLSALAVRRRVVT